MGIDPPKAHFCPTCPGRSSTASPSPSPIMRAATLSSTASLSNPLSSPRPVPALRRTHPCPGTQLSCLCPPTAGSRPVLLSVDAPGTPPPLMQPPTLSRCWASSATAAKLLHPDLVGDHWRPDSISLFAASQPDRSAAASSSFLLGTRRGPPLSLSCAKTEAAGEAPVPPFGSCL